MSADEAGDHDGNCSEWIKKMQNALSSCMSRFVVNKHDAGYCQDDDLIQMTFFGRGSDMFSPISTQYIKGQN